MSGGSVVKEEQIRILMDASQQTQLSHQDAVRLIGIPDQPGLLECRTARNAKNRARWIHEPPQNGVKTNNGIQRVGSVDRLGTMAERAPGVIDDVHAGECHDEVRPSFQYAHAPIHVSWVDPVVMRQPHEIAATGLTKHRFEIRDRTHVVFVHP